MRKYGFSALAAAGLIAGGLSVPSASAADFGGDCCADLEERVAELEATTVRKGNRKVSLTITGWVAEQVTFWDDGTEDNIYVSGIGKTLASHFKLTGAAQITADTKAGYMIHVEVSNVDPTDVTQINDDAGLGLNLLQSYWFLESKTLGKISVGQLSHASDNTAILVDGSGSLVPANWVHFDALSFTYRNGGVLSGVTVAALAHCRSIGVGFAGDCNGYPNNAVRYDTPTFGGFSLSASWGEDDFWDVAIRWAGNLGDIKISAAAAYHHTSEETLLLGQLGIAAADVAKRDSGYYQAGLYVQHVPTGLFAYGAYGTEDDNSTYFNAVTQANVEDGTTWYLKAGIRGKWSTLGNTVLYGEYLENDDTFSTALAAGGVIGSEQTQWGVGVVQEIDAAAMSLWLAYRNLDGEFSTAVGTTELDDIDIIKAGALIAF